MKFGHLLAAGLVVLSVASYAFLHSYTYISLFSTQLSTVRAQGSEFYSLKMPFSSEKIYYYTNPPNPLALGPETDGVRYIHGVDIDSFEVINPTYAKDSNHVYFGDRESQRLTSVSGVSPDDFIFIDGHYGHDGNHLFFNGFKIPNTDATNFRFLDTIEDSSVDGSRMFYSNDQVYYRNSPMADKAKHNGTFMVSASLKSLFTCPAEQLIKSNFYVCSYKHLKGDSHVAIDMETFNLVGKVHYSDATYATDKNHVYYIDFYGGGVDKIQGIYVVEGADPESFFLSSDMSTFAHDKHSWDPNFGYLRGCAVPVANKITGDESKQIIVYRRSRPNIGSGGRCVYHTKGENPKQVTVTSY